MQITVGISHYYCIIVGIYHPSECQSNNFGDELVEIWMVILVISPSGRQLFAGNATQSLTQASSVSILVVKTCTPAADTGEKQGEAGMKHGGLMVTTSTPGEVTGKWRKKKETRQQTVPLPEHLGERGVAVI